MSDRTAATGLPVVADDDPPQVVEQMLDLAADAVIGATRGQVFGQNYVISLPPAGRMSTEVEAEIAREMAPLNSADRQLCQFMGDLVSDIEADGGVSPVRYRRARELHDEWTRALDVGANLLGADLAVALTAALESHVDVRAELRNRAPGILAAFRYPGPEVVEVTRINLFVPPVASRRVASLLLAETSGQGWLGHLDRVDVSKHLIVGALGRTPAYPSVIIYLNRRAVGDSRTAWSGILGLAAEVAAAVGGDPVPDGAHSTYSLVVGGHLSVGQGFRLYKRYLDVLGLLDEVYDPGRNHALALRPTSPAGRWLQELVDG
ncbi:MAG TPA: hypothetical protein ENI86_18050 [Acidimicrobiales bacterium]|nr:hypothetical protein [Acidimicrobiales bacterium]